MALALSLQCMNPHSGKTPPLNCLQLQDNGILSFNQLPILAIPSQGRAGFPRATQAGNSRAILGRSAGFPTWLSWFQAGEIAVGRQSVRAPQTPSSPDASRPSLPRKEYRPQSGCRLASKGVWSAKSLTLPQRSTAAGQTFGVPKAQHCAPKSHDLAPQQHGQGRRGQ